MARETERVRAVPTISWVWVRSEFYRGLRFVLVGVVGLGTDTSIFMAMFEIGTPKPVARALSLLVATSVTWALNRIVTFARTHRAPTGELGRYGLVALIAQSFNWALFLWLSSVFANTYPPLLIFCSAAAAGIFSYLGQRLFTFAQRMPLLRKDAS